MDCCRAHLPLSIMSESEVPFASAVVATPILKDWGAKRATTPSQHSGGLLQHGLELVAGE